MFLIFYVLIAVQISGPLADQQFACLQTHGSVQSFDSLNMRFVGNWPFGPSWEVCYDKLRHIAFLGAGGALYVLDVADPSNIIALCEAIKTRGFITNLYYDSLSQRLYIAAGIGGFEIWDFTNPSFPLKIVNFSIPAIVNGVFVVGELAYLACGSEGLRILDISNPFNPYEIGYCLTPDSAMDVVVSGNYAYVGNAHEYYNGGGLAVIDISVPSNPQVVGYCDTPNFAHDLEVVGSYAYVVDGEPGAVGLHIIDISVPTNPHRVGLFMPDTMQWFTVCMGVCIRDTIAFVAYHNPGIFIVNIANPANPVKIVRYDTPGQAMEVCVGDSLLYVADDEYWLCIVDVSALTSSFEIGHYDGYYAPNFVYAKDTLIFLSHGEEGLVRILNIADPTNPQFLSQITTTYGADGLFTLEPYLYVTDWNGLCIVDISNPANPQMLGFIDLDGYPSGVWVVDTFAYVASYWSGLYVVNVANPTNPFLVGYCSAPYEANDVEVIGSYAYVANYYAGIRIINITNPANPFLVGSCNTEALRIDVAGSFAYAAASDSGLRIVDISDPAHPYEIGRFPTSSPTIDVHNVENLTYITDNRFGVRAINTSNPYAPVEVGFYKLPNMLVGHMGVVDSLVCVGSRFSGLQIFCFMPLGIRGLQKGQEVGEISVSPNPISAGILFIALPPELRGEVKIVVYNTLGQRASICKVINREGFWIGIPVDGLNIGVYFVEIITPAQRKVCKFVKVK